MIVVVGKRRNNVILFSVEVYDIECRIISLLAYLTMS